MEALVNEDQVSTGDAQRAKMQAMSAAAKGRLGGR